MIFFFAYNLFVSHNICSLDLYSGDLQTTTVLFACNVSSHQADWVTTTRCLLCDQSDEGSWSEMFGALPPQEFYYAYIVFCVFCTQCLLLLVYSFFSYACCWFTWNKLDIFVSVAFVYCLMLNDIILFLFSKQYIVSSNELSFQIFWKAFRCNFQIFRKFLANIFQLSFKKCHAPYWL